MLTACSLDHYLPWQTTLSVPQSSLQTAAAGRPVSPWRARSKPPQEQLNANHGRVPLWFLTREQPAHTQSNPWQPWQVHINANCSLCTKWRQRPTKHFSKANTPRKAPATESQKSTGGGPVEPSISPKPTHLERHLQIHWWWPSGWYFSIFPPKV